MATRPNCPKCGEQGTIHYVLLDFWAHHCQLTDTTVYWNEFETTDSMDMMEHLQGQYLELHDRR